MHHTILFKNLHSNSISIPCTTKLAFSDSASLLAHEHILDYNWKVEVENVNTCNLAKPLLNLHERDINCILLIISANDWS